MIVEVCLVCNLQYLFVCAAFFEEGSTLLLRVALALVKLQEEALYGMRDAGEFLQAFQTLPFSAEQIFDAVGSLALPAQEELLEQKRAQKYAAVARLRDKTRRKSLLHRYPHTRACHGEHVVSSLYLTSAQTLWQATSSKAW